MSLETLFILAVAAMTLLGVSRVVRVHLGRAPHPEGTAKLLFVLAFVVVPPVALGALIQPDAASGRLGGVASVPLYAILLAGLAILMVLVALVIRFLAPGRSRRLLLLALVGSEGNPDEVPIDPPVTAQLAESLTLVDRANAVFPRGPEFPVQIDRPGFRVAWDALDSATRTLEDRIADDQRLGMAVASAAKATALDARSRLSTLRGLAVGQGQVWAG